MATASDTVTGYGLALCAWIVRSLCLTGSEKIFQFLSFAGLKTASLSSGLDGLLLHPEDFEEQVAQARLRTQPSSRRGASASEPAELESAQKALAALEHKRVQLAHLLISLLSESVLHLLLQTLPAGKQFDPTSIVAFLKSTYGLSDVQKAASENAESNILQSLGWKWQKGHFVDFVRKIHQRVSVLFMHRKLVEVLPRVFVLLSSSSMYLGRLLGNC